VTDRFQDDRRRHVGNSSACYKMGNYHPISMKFGAQTKTDMLSLKVMKAEVYGHFSKWQLPWASTRNNKIAIICKKNSKN
jgi:hypothetical protein